jgi:hypothetical protein
MDMTALRVASSPRGELGFVAASPVDGVLSMPVAVGGSIRFAARPGFARWHSRPAL